MSDPSVHRQAWDLIPWIVNGSASDEQMAGVQPHLQQCSDCRDELDHQRRLCALMQERTVPELDADAGWQRLRTRLDAEMRRPARTQGRSRTARHAMRVRMLPGLMAASIVEAVLIGVLAAALWSHPAASTSASAAAPLYRTLASGDTTPPAATIRVVFSPSMTVGQVQALLRSSGLRAIGGPSEAGVWSLAPAAGSRQAAAAQAATAAAVKRLRADGNVRFAEPIDAH